jgi:hypothetical protein
VRDWAGREFCAGGRLLPGLGCPVRMGMGREQERTDWGCARIAVSLEWARRESCAGGRRSRYKSTRRTSGGRRSAGCAGRTDRQVLQACAATGICQPAGARVGEYPESSPKPSHLLRRRRDRGWWKGARVSLPSPRSGRMWSSFKEGTGLRRFGFVCAVVVELCPPRWVVRRSSCGGSDRTPLSR